jgi:hypothetical protein
MAQNEAALKQATSASSAAKRLMDDADKENGSKSVENKKEVEDLKSKLTALREGN